MLEPAATDRVMVPFAGPEAGVAPLTWGQKAILEDMHETGWTHNASGWHPLPPGTTVEDVAEQIRRLMSSHPALRMRLRHDEQGQPGQDVAASGEVGLDVLTFDDDAEPDDVMEYANRLWYERLLEPYQLDRDWSMRTAVLRHRGATLHRVLTFQHLAVDGTAVALLLAELGVGDMLAARDGARTVDVLQLAAQEQTPKLRQVSNRALEYWRTRMVDIPPRTFGPPIYPDGRHGKRYWHGRFSSKAAYLALLAIAARTRTDTSSVLLAIITTAIARATGVCPVTAKVIVSNRFRPGLADAIAPLSQNSVVTVDVADITIDEAVVRARRASLAASMHAYYDPDQLRELTAELEQQRGYPARISCRINDRRLRSRRRAEAAVPENQITMEQIRAKLPDTFLSWDGTVDMLPEQAFITVEDVRETVLLQVIFDMACFTEEQVETLLRGVEEIAVEAAFDAAAPTRVARP